MDGSSDYITAQFDDISLNCLGNQADIDKSRQEQIYGIHALMRFESLQNYGKMRYNHARENFIVLKLPF